VIRGHDQPLTDRPHPLSFQLPTQGIPSNGGVVVAATGVMALAPPRPCSVLTCPNLNCQTPGHQVEAWRTRARPIVIRVRGRRLQQLRAELFARHPWCARCLLTGIFTRPTIRDHIVPLAEGGRDAPTNDGCQALCAACSKTKTAAESARGRRRG